MHIYKSTAARITGLALIGGLATGGLLALSTPTHMQREGGTWREMIGVRDVAVQDSAVPVYAPPEDLTPVHWQSAAEEYPAGPAVDWSASGTDYQTTDYSAADYQDDAAIDTDAPEMIAVNTGDPAVRDDDAAASADAALAAAQDVRAQENAAVDPQASAPAPTPSSDANVT